MKIMLKLAWLVPLAIIALNFGFIGAMVAFVVGWCIYRAFKEPRTHKDNINGIPHGK